MSQGMFLAKALYDNVAETSDELAFRRGDVLTVLQQDTNGIEGWWLCSLRGKSGIAPGNRLKIVSGMGEVSGGFSGGGAFNKRLMDSCDQPSRGLQDYDVPPSNRSSSSRRPSYDLLRNFTGSRKASLADDLYDTPPSSKRGSAETANTIYDTPTSSKRASSERTPPHSNRSSLSRELGLSALQTSSLNQLSLSLQQGGCALPSVIRRRSGSYSSDNCNGSNRSSLDRILCEEGPPIYESLSPATSSEQLDSCDPTYDTPPSRSHILSQVNPASRSSLGSAASSESLLSNTSSIGSSHMARTTSLPDSARSSMDLPADIYDVPPRAQETDRSRKQLSMDSGLGFYDSPVRSRPSSSTSNNVTLESLRSSHSSFDCKSTSSSRDMQRSKSLENAVDDLYDTPRNNAPKIGHKILGGVTGSGLPSPFCGPSGVYDIPPQVTRDSVISMRSDSSDENGRFSSSSLDNDQQMAEVLQWDELLLDLDSALELLVKRQQEMFKATSRLTSFVNNTWRSQSSLEKTLYDIKMSCTLVRNSLYDFVGFSHGAIANAVRLPDHQLTCRLHKYVSPLQNALELVNRSFINLEEMKWQVSLLSEPFNKSRPDDLGQIALVARELMPEVKKVASLIQSNGSILFKKSVVGDGRKHPVSSKPPIVPKASDNNESKGPGYAYGKPKHMQHRPLPAVPSSDKCVPATATPPLADNRRQLSLYEIKAALHKDDYAECDELPPENDPQQTHKVLSERCKEEYDYVQLDTRDSHARSQSKHIELLVESDEKSDQDDVDAVYKTQTNVMRIKDMTPRKLETHSDIELVPVKDRAGESCKDITDFASEKKISDSTSEKKISDSTSEKKISDSTSEKKISDSTSEKKISDSTSEKKISDSTSEKKISDSTSEKKISDSTTEKKIFDSTTEKKISDSTSEKKISDSTSEKKISDSTSEKKISHSTFEEKTDSQETPELDLSEEDFPTPVNVSNSSTSGTDFIFPCPESDQVAGESELLDPNDRQVLVYYTEQMNAHSTLLANAIDAFIGVVRSKEPPNVFISHSKFVIVSAHKLVHIGDSIHRNLVSNSVSLRVMQCANHLCDCLKTSVLATKTAALQYPSAPAVQEMVDRVIAVSHAAHELKLVITQVAKQ